MRSCFALCFVVLVACAKHIDDPPLQLSTLTPTVVCGEASSKITISGHGLRPLTRDTLTGPRLELPKVTLRETMTFAGTVPSPTSFTIPDDPSAPEASDVSLASPEEMSFTLCPPGTCSKQTPKLTDVVEAPPGLYAIEVSNPTGAGAALPDSLLILPPSKLTSLSDDLLCGDHANVLTIKGQNLYEIDGDPGQVMVGGVAFTPALSDCRVLPSPSGVLARACKKADLTLPVGSLMPGSAPIQIKSPGTLACVSGNALLLTVVSSPAVTDVSPDLVCVASGLTSLTVKGSGFLSVGATLPTVNVDGTAIPATSVSNCVTVTGPSKSVQSCGTLTVQVPAATIGVGISAVTVTNPAAAACSSAPAPIGIVPVPQLTTVTHDLACQAMDTTFVLEGAGFASTDDSAPTVTISNGSNRVALPGTRIAASCSGMMENGGTLTTCTQMSVTVPAGTLSLGTNSFVVTNADGCATSAGTSLLVPAPTLTSVTPTPVCTAQNAVDLLVQGSDFLVIAGATPSLTLSAPGANNVTLTTAPVTGACSAVSGPAESVRRCTQLIATIAKDALPPDLTFMAVLTNPSPAACSSSGAVTVDTKPPPVVTGFVPSYLCRGVGDITIAGSALRSGASVKVGTQQATAVTVSQDGTSATAHLGGGLSANATYSVELSAGDGCSAVAPNRFEIKDEATVLLADPPVVWGAVATKVRLYGSHVTGAFSGVSLRSADGAVVPLTIALDGQHPNRLEVTIPAGTTAGTYDLLVADASPCAATASAALKVVTNSTLSGLAISPAGGSSTVDMVVRIQSNGGFQAIPRVFLAMAGTPTRPLRSVTFLDASTLEAVVPAGMAAGLYDLIVINPNGTTGTLASAYTVTAALPPTITRLEPGAITFQSSQAFRIIGTQFQSGATVALSCRDQNNAGIAPPSVSALPCSGAPTTCIDATTTVNSAGACVVTVVNPDGGQVAFSSLVVQDPGTRIGPFRATSTMVEARRGLGLAIATMSTGRFVYAMGGDNGAATGAVATVESASLDPFGNLGPWTVARSMPTRHTLLGAVGIGRFIYAIGGTNGTTDGAITKVERAAVLEPTAAPVIADHDLTEASGTGLTGGQFSYRVSAIMGASDAFNPSGEGLASSPYVVTVPNVSNRVVLTLTWNSLPGVMTCPSNPGHAACGYRVYRSPAGGGSGSEVLIAENIAATSFADTGAGALQINGASVRPVPPGTLGAWAAVSDMRSQRSGPAIATLVDVNDPTVTYVYAMAGNDRYESAPNLLSSTEYVKVTTATDGSQSFGSWQQGPNLSRARWQAGGYGMNLGGTNYLWIGPGRDSGVGLSDAVEGSVVASSGAPGSFSVLAERAGDRAGYAPIGANGVFFAFGGANGQADKNVRQTSVATPPATNAWSNATATMVQERLNAASVALGGFIIVCGGRTDSAQATKTCETTVW